MRKRARHERELGMRERQLSMRRRAKHKREISMRES